MGLDKKKCFVCKRFVMWSDKHDPLQKPLCSRKSCKRLRV